MALTRRELLEAAGAGVAVAAPGQGVFGQRPDGPNVLVVVIDTLRANYVGAYRGRAATPTIDSLAREGLRVTRCHPEAMATVPARRSIVTSRRVFPFCGWRPQPDELEERLREQAGGRLPSYDSRGRLRRR